MAGSPFPTASPSNQFGPSRNLVIDQQDKFLYVTASAGISGFSIDPNNGALSAIGGSPLQCRQRAAFAGDHALEPIPV
jgi:6-phosphogluconolactonase (cycloisomerase 2 family)